MKASETSLRNLLEGAKQFQIPLFQRPYSWKKGNWETLWEDLMSLYTAEGKDFYFLGPIVTQSIPGTAEGISPFIVIDGTSEERDNAYLIFESLNNKGEELTQADLVRNYIFMKLPSENREEVYQKKWGSSGLSVLHYQLREFMTLTTQGL